MAHEGCVLSSILLKNELQKLFNKDLIRDNPMNYPFIAQRNFADRALGLLFDSSALGRIASSLILL